MTKGFDIEYPLLSPVGDEEMPSGRCPHCARHTVFSNASHPVVPMPLTQRRPHHYKQGLKRGTLTLVVCGHQDCRSVVYREHDPEDEENTWDMYPPVELAVEPELPGEIKRSYGEALSTFANKEWNSSAQASRRALQDAMTLKKPEDTKAENWADKQLKRQIDTLVQRRILTPELGTWAQEARIVGVIAAHGEPEFKDWADEQDAKEALEFTKWVLRYLFVLPGQLENRKARLAEEASKTGQPPAKR